LKLAHVIGLVLWRGGLLLVGVVLLYELASWVLQFVDLPVQLGVGLGLVATGVVFVLISMIAERVRDYGVEARGCRD